MMGTKFSYSSFTFEVDHYKIKFLLIIFQMHLNVYIL